MSPFVGLSILVLGMPMFVSAATLNLTLDKDAIAIGDEFHAEIMIDSEGTAINAAQATLKFNNDIVNITKVEKVDSIFTFWLTDPSFSNDNGTLSFLGGSTSGFNGKSLQVLRATFKVIGSGTLQLAFTDGAITSSDGSGSNVFSGSKGLEIPVLTKSELTQVKIGQIERTPTLADGSPTKPQVTVGLYPNPANWYNQSADFSASWGLPRDISAVATVLNKDPLTQPTNSKGLFDNENFKALGSGVWYLHVRFQNNIGWGATNHYRIAIDTVPPAAFVITSGSGLSSDDPTPTLSYATRDQYSGIDTYSITVDGKDEVKTNKATYVTPPIQPGKRTIIILARDKAGNTTESRLAIDVLPIESPQIIAINKDVYIGEGNFSANGSALADTELIVAVKNEAGAEVYTTTTTTGNKGIWSLTIDQPFTKGRYVLVVTSRDKRGAESLPISSSSIYVRPRPIFSFGGIEITDRTFVVLLILFFCVAFGAGWYVRRLAMAQRRRRTIIAERDVNAVLVSIQKDLDKLIAKHAALPIQNESQKNEVQVMLKRMNDRIMKTKGYVLENIDEID